MKDVTTDPEKVDRILVSAMKEFGQKGFLKAKTDTIAAAAGVSKGLVFHYFGNKNALYKDTYDYVYQRLYTKMDWSVWRSGKTLSEMVTNAAWYKMSLQIKFPAEFQFMMEAYADVARFPPALRKQMAIENQKVSALGSSIIDDFVRQLPLRAGVSEAAVIAVVNAVVAAETYKTEALIEKLQSPTMEDFKGIITELHAQLDVLEHGFLA